MHEHFAQRHPSLAGNVTGDVEVGRLGPPRPCGAPARAAAGVLPQARQPEAMAILVIRLLFGGYDPHSVFAFISPGRTGQPFASR